MGDRARNKAGSAALTRLCTFLPHDQPVQRVDASGQLPREIIDVLGVRACVSTVAVAATGQAIERNNYMRLG